MMKRPFVVLILTATIALPGGFVWAADPEPGQVPPQTQPQEQIYGSQLMTPQERTEYQTTMRAAKTDEERAQIRQQHHEKMQAVAKARGLTLPDEPPARGGGMGMGGGAMGPDSGMGHGGGGMGQGGGGMGQGGGGMGQGGGGMGHGGGRGR